MGRGGTCHRWAPLVWSIVMQEDQGCACIEYGYARHRAEGPTSTKAPRGGSAKTDSSGRPDARICQRKGGAGAGWSILGVGWNA
jgi:hypothetical protein